MLEKSKMVVGRKKQNDLWQKKAKWHWSENSVCHVCHNSFCFFLPTIILPFSANYNFAFFLPTIILLFSAIFIPFRNSNINSRKKHHRFFRTHIIIAGSISATWLQMALTLVQILHALLLYSTRVVPILLCLSKLPISKLSQQ